MVVLLLSLVGWQGGNENTVVLPSFVFAHMDRFRLETGTRRGDMLQVCDGGTCWAYSSLKKEYTIGKTFREVNASVGSPLLLPSHVFPFLALQEGVIQDLTVVGEEEVEVGKERLPGRAAQAVRTASLRGPEQAPAGDLSQRRILCQEGCVQKSGRCSLPCPIG